MPVVPLRQCAPAGSRRRPLSNDNSQKCGTTRTAPLLGIGPLGVAPAGWEDRLGRVSSTCDGGVGQGFLLRGGHTVAPIPKRPWQCAPAAAQFSLKGRRTHAGHTEGGRRDDGRKTRAHRSKGTERRDLLWAPCVGDCFSLVSGDIFNLLCVGLF